MNDNTITLTQKQADAIQAYTVDRICSAFEFHRAFYNREVSFRSEIALAIEERTGMKQDNELLILHKLFTGDYEIEVPPIVAGDLVVRRDGSCFSNGRFIGEVEVVTDEFAYITNCGDRKLRFLELATDEEIKRQKQADLWDSIDRNEGEFVHGDVIVRNNNNVILIASPEGVSMADRWFREGTMSSFYPFESALNLNGRDV